MKFWFNRVVIIGGTLGNGYGVFKLGPLMWNAEPLPTIGLIACVVVGLVSIWQEDWA